MPLDGHLYLVSQGWRGKGTGLRDGAIARPLIIPQKKNLAGVGKDRDEAFPFWDHLFTAAAKSIQLKCTSDSDEEGNAEISCCSQGAVRRTATGILSNRRPVDGTSATSTPSVDSDSSKPRINLLAAAKRDAAKQNLYSRFFRGPILGPDNGNSGPISRDIEGIIETSLIVEKSVKAGRASKRKRDLEEGSGNGLGQQKKRQKRDGRQVGLNAINSKADKKRTHFSVAEGPAKGIDSELERKSHKAEKRVKEKKKELEWANK